MHHSFRQFGAILFALLAIQADLKAQNAVCLTDELMMRGRPEVEALLEQLNAQAWSHQQRQGGGSPVVPVVVHVVWNTASENISDAVIQGFVAQMDEDFNLMNANAGSVRPAFTSVVADVGIRFCLAQYDPQGNATTGITRTYTTDTWFDPNNEPHKMKGPPDGISAWDPTRYLNIWVCDIVGSSGSIVSGYTYLPTGGMAGSWQDGLVIDYYYGTQPSARTPTHEAGHYFGLRHTFDGNSCFADDGFTDTPNTNSPTWNCNNTNLMKCSVLTQYENYMDYSGCTAMFTMQQAAYMNGVLNGVRSSLLGSTGCAGWSALPEDDEHPRAWLHPNPVSDALTVRVASKSPVAYRLIDATGRAVRQGSLIDGALLSVADLAPGLHWLQLEGAGWTQTLKTSVIR